MANENLESKRWGIAAAAVVIQLCLGTVYAWSVFKIPLMKMHGWEGKNCPVHFHDSDGHHRIGCRFWRHAC